MKRQQIAAKKIFSIDTGLVNNIGFNFSPNTGKLLENAAFLALRRKFRDIFYFVTPSGYEIDFYLPETRQLVQVAQNMDNPATREREIRALSEAMKTFHLSTGILLTESRSQTITSDGNTIQRCSLAEWLVENE